MYAWLSPVPWFPQFFQIVVLMKQVKLFGGESSGFFNLESHAILKHQAAS